MTNRIDHTGHRHPNTTAARQVCRKEILAADAAVKAHYAAFPVISAPKPRMRRGRPVGCFCSFLTCNCSDPV